MDACCTEFEERVQAYEKLWAAHYDEGVPRHFDGGDVTLKQLMLDVRSTKPDAVHLVHGEREWTWSESDAIACRLANALVRRGAKKGQRVAMVLGNVPEMVFGYMACYKLGLVAVGVNPRFTPREIALNLQDSGAVFALVGEGVLEKVEEARQSDSVQLASIIVVREDGELRDANAKKPCWPEMYELIAGENDAEPEAEVDPDDVQVLAYTGGTTGVSKGCCHTSRMIFLHAKAWACWFAPALQGKDIKVLVSLPMTHAYAITCAVNLPIVSGGTAVIGRGVGIDDVLADIDRHEPNVWPSIPAFITPLANRNDLRKTKVDNIDIILCGSAPLSEETLRRFKSASSARLIEGYGLSEATSCVSFNPMGTQKPFSVGLPICNTDALVVDVETGERLVDTGEYGEIIVRGPQMIDGYWGHPDETDATIRNGWLHTGDIGCIDEDGFLHIHSRKKNMLIVGGFNVFPQDIDDALTSHPGVCESVTVGAPHTRLGEVAVSFVVPRSGAALSPKDLEAHCRARLTGYKVPKLICVVPEIPRTPVNKPDVARLKKVARDLYVQKGL